MKPAWSVKSASHFLSMSCLICSLWFDSVAVCGVYFSLLRKEYNEKPQVRNVRHT